MAAKVSLIITVYNRSHLLRKALLSLPNQTILPDELILSDDGSDEDIPASIKDITGMLNFPVKFVSQEHNGFRLAKCRNNGVKFSSGDLLIFLDQDLVLSEQFIELLVAQQNKNLFLTSYPVRLSEEQSEKLTEQKIRNNEIDDIPNVTQINKIKSQYRKDMLSYVLNKIGLEKNKPKLRGGACAINRSDYEKVNGYDENFIGWGNEDDDIRRRLYKAGVKGYNPHRNDFALHLYHEKFHDNGKRVNQEYSEIKSEAIKKGQIVCEKGLKESSVDELVVKELN